MSDEQRTREKRGTKRDELRNERLPNIQDRNTIDVLDATEPLFDSEVGHSRTGSELVKTKRTRVSSSKLLIPVVGFDLLSLTAYPTLFNPLKLTPPNLSSTSSSSNAQVTPDIELQSDETSMVRMRGLVSRMVSEETMSSGVRGLRRDLDSRRESLGVKRCEGRGGGRGEAAKGKRKGKGEVW